MASSPTPKAMADHDVIVVLDRLKGARDPKDRAAFVAQLQALGEEDPGRVSRLAVPLAVDMLRARRLGQLDEGTAQAILELLEGLLTGGKEAALKALVADATSLDALLDMVEGSDTLTTVGALQVVQAALAVGPVEVEAALQGAGGSQQGLVRLVACLSDEREEVRNEVLLVLGRLTAGSRSANLKTLVAFNEGFERLLAMMEDDGGLLEGGGVITQDCLRLLGNVVEGTPSAQRQFVELGPLDALAPWLDAARLVPSESEEEGSGRDKAEEGLPLLDARQVAAFHLALRILRNLAAGPADDEHHDGRDMVARASASGSPLSPSETRAAADRRQRQLRVAGCRGGQLLAALVQMATCPWRDEGVATQVQAEALRVLALLAEGNAEVQDRLLRCRLDPLSFAWADNDGIVTEADRANGSAALPAALLRLALRGRHPAVRAGARLALHRALDGNEMGCVMAVQHVIAPPLPPLDEEEAEGWAPAVPFGVVLLEEAVTAVSQALAAATGGSGAVSGGPGPAEVEAAQAACFFLEHVLAQGGLAARELATRLPADLGEKGGKDGDGPRYLLDWVALLLRQALAAGAPALEPVGVALLRLLAVWAGGCPAAARALVRAPSNLFLFDALHPAATAGGAAGGPRLGAQARALAALVVGVCLEHWGDGQDEASGLGRAEVQAMVEARGGGLGAFTAALEGLERVLVPGKNFVGAWPAPEGVEEAATSTAAARWPYYDSRFVALYRREAKAVRRRLLLAGGGGGESGGGAVDAGGGGAAAGGVQGAADAARYLEVIAEQEKEIDSLKVRIERVLAQVPGLQEGQLPDADAAAAGGGGGHGGAGGGEGLDEERQRRAAAEAAVAERDGRLAALQAEMEELQRRLASVPAAAAVDGGGGGGEWQARLAAAEQALAGKEDEVRKLGLELQKAAARERRAAEEGAAAAGVRVAVEGELEAVNAGYQALQQQLEQAHRAAHEEAQRRKCAEQERARLEAQVAELQQQPQQQPPPPPAGPPTADGADAAALAALRAEVDSLRAQAAQLPEYQRSLEEYRAYGETLSRQLEELTRYSAEQEQYAAGLAGQVAALTAQVQEAQHQQQQLQHQPVPPVSESSSAAVEKEAGRLRLALQEAQHAAAEAAERAQAAAEALEAKEAETEGLKQELAALKAEGTLPSAASLFPPSPPRGPGAQQEGSAAASLFPPSFSSSSPFPSMPPPQEDDEERRQLQEQAASLNRALAEATARVAALEEEAQGLRAAAAAEGERAREAAEALRTSEAHAEGLIGEAGRLTARVRELEAAVAAGGAEAANAAAHAAEQLRLVVEERDAALARVAAAEERVAATGQGASETERALGEARARVAALEEQVAGATARLVEEESRFSLVQAELATALQTSEEAARRIEELERGAAEAAQVDAGTVAALTARVEEMDRAASAAAADADGLRAQLAEAAQAREEALGHVASLEAEAQRALALDAELAESRASLAAAQEEIRALEDRAQQAQAAAEEAAAAAAAAAASATAAAASAPRDGAVTPSQPTREELLRALAERESESRELDEDKEILTREFQALVHEAKEATRAALGERDEALSKLATTEARLQQHVDSLHSAWAELEAAQRAGSEAVAAKEKELMGKEEDLALLRTRYEALATRRGEIAALLEEKDGLEGELFRLREHVGELEAQLQAASAGWKGLVEEREAEVRGLREAVRQHREDSLEEIGQAQGTILSLLETVGAASAGEPSSQQEQQQPPAPVSSSAGGDAQAAAAVAAAEEEAAALRGRVADLEGQLQALRGELGRQQAEQAALDGSMPRVDATELSRLQGEVDRLSALLAEREAEARRLKTAGEELSALRTHAERVRADLEAEQATGRRREEEWRVRDTELTALLSSLELRLGPVTLGADDAAGAGAAGSLVGRLRWYVGALSARLAETEAAAAAKAQEVAAAQAEVRALRAKVEEGLRRDAEAGERLRGVQEEKARAEAALHAELDELRVALARQAEELAAARESGAQDEVSAAVQPEAGGGSGGSGSLVLEGARMELKSLRADYEALRKKHAAAQEEARGRLERVTALLEAKEAAMAAVAREHGRLKNEMEFELRLRGGMLADREKSLEALTKKLAEQRRAGQAQGEALEARALAAEEECASLKVRVEELGQRLAKASAAAAAAAAANGTGAAMASGTGAGPAPASAALQASLRERDGELARAQDQALTLRHERDRLKRAVEEARAAQAESLRRVRAELTAALEQNAALQLELNGRELQHSTLRRDLLAARAEAAKHEGLAALQREAETRLRDKERRVEALEGQVRTLAAQRDHLRDKLEETWSRIAAGTLDLTPLAPAPGAHHPAATAPAAGAGTGRGGGRRLVIPGEEEGAAGAVGSGGRWVVPPAAAGAAASGAVVDVSDMALEEDLVYLKSRLTQLRRDLGEERLLHQHLEQEHEEMLEVLATHDLSAGGGAASATSAVFDEPPAPLHHHPQQQPQQQQHASYPYPHDQQQQQQYHDHLPPPPPPPQHGGYQPGLV